MQASSRSSIVLPDHYHHGNDGETGVTCEREARRDGLPVKELRADKDKVARSLPLEARMEHGTVWFPRDAAWLPDLQRELLSFPVGEHDDQVDALAYAAAAMSQSKIVHDWSQAGPDDLTQRAGFQP